MAHHETSAGGDPGIGTASMTKVTCIIQARRQSTRLPDKILLPLGKRPVLGHVVARCRAIDGVDTVIVACPEGAHEDPVANAAEEAGALSYRGDMDDVLARYWGAHQMAPADYVIRVTADCPLLDPGLCSELVHRAVKARADYGGLGGWPHGMECEIFSAALLETAHQQATNPADREHVTLWMKKQEGLTKVFHSPAGTSYRTDNRWVVDYPEDYAFMQALFDLFPEGEPPMDWADILSVLDANPALRAINAAREDEWVAASTEIYRQSGQDWNPPG